MPAATSDAEYRKRFFNALADRPLDPADKHDQQLYVPLYDLGVVDEDPVLLLVNELEYSLDPTTAQLVSGYAGSGKSTELYRLADELRRGGYAVVRCDMRELVNVSAPLSITDLLLVLVGALEEKLEEGDLLDEVVDGERWYDRVGRFLRRIRFDSPELEVGADVGGGFSASLKTSLRVDPDFKRRLQDHLAGHLGAVVTEAHDHVRQLALRTRGPNAGIVFIVDSLEHFRDTVPGSTDVQDSIQQVFAQHADHLHLPLLHTIYTVPPELKVREKMLGQRYEGGITMFRAVRVRQRSTGAPSPAGLDAMATIIAEREPDWARLVGDRAALDRLILASGGHLRTLLRLLQGVIRRAVTHPVSADVLAKAQAQLRDELLPLSLDTRRWLSRVAGTDASGLPTDADLDRLARYLAMTLVLAYRNGDEWYDVHPLVADVIVGVDEPPEG